jgi:hypothetical protein
MKKFLGGVLVAVGSILFLFGSGLLFLGLFRTGLGLFRTGEVSGLIFIVAEGAFGTGLLLTIAGDVLMDTDK